MKIRILALTIAFLVSAVVTAQDKPKAAPKTESPIFKPAADLKWTDLDPTGAPGIKIVDLWGDLA